MINVNGAYLICAVFVCAACINTIQTYFVCMTDKEIQDLYIEYKKSKSDLSFSDWLIQKRMDERKERKVVIVIKGGTCCCETHFCCCN